MLITSQNCVLLAGKVMGHHDETAKAPHICD